MLYLINEETLVSIADAIREKVGNLDSISPLDMPELIRGIKTSDGIGFKVISSEDLFLIYATGELVDVNTPVINLDMPMQFKGAPKVITVSVVEG